MLGGGGTVGLAYHAGVLRALERVAGIPPDSADLVVGTSAGSVAGAYIRSGWSAERLWQLALGAEPSLEALSPEELEVRRRNILAPAFTDSLTLARRLVGSAYVVGRCVVRVPMPWLKVPPVLERAFPGGVFAMHEGRRRFSEELPAAWPGKPTWLCAVDIDGGRRVVLGRDGDAPPTSLQAAVSASCAIPGVYAPVRVGPLTLVDGGVYSSTNLDVAAAAGCRVIVGVVPLAWDTASAHPPALTQLARRGPARRAVQEMAAARRQGAEVLLLRPSAAELRLHGVNLMRGHGWDLVARAAYESAARQLDRPRSRAVLAGVAGSSSEDSSVRMRAIGE